MVKHGKNKKRRSGRKGKTKLKNRSYLLFKPPQIQDPVIRENWDPRKSPSVNMANLGLRHETKVENKINEVSENPIEKCKAVELYDVPDSDVIPKKTLSQRMLPVSIENQKYMVKLFARYGNDYTKMSRDIKINNMQHTERKLQKLGARFLLLNPQEIRVEIPDEVKRLMACM